MNDLTKDAAPLGNAPRPNFMFNQQHYPHFRPQAPQVFNITGSTGVHIGPVIHQVQPRPAPPYNPADLPLKRDVYALLQCERVVSEEEKLIVSEHLGEVWTTLGRFMGFSSGQLENLKADYSRSQDRSHEMLNMWHDREAEGATMKALTTHLLDAKAYAVVKRLRA
ncbi:hypothetical protein Pmani_003618 [Petrolisthes manimaculis]|uniref:Death domain-containing protein n=1 Tax=Petrolisthes manimaculis TaxID=1843537 RepID=A0AAE1QII2_9EUCA|nr:hypothetical protein Pmani_003618 [Petrolisthes manimaculis]